MTPRAERYLWGLAAVGTILAVGGTRYGGAVRVTPTRPPIQRPAELTMFDDAHIASAADTAIVHDLFRLDRRPAAVAFGAPATAGPASSGTPVQTITLRGIVGGPPWQAILEGVPGRSGHTVVRAGDTLAGYRVRHVLRDTVVLIGRDSSITLTLHRQWQ